MVAPQRELEDAVDARTAELIALRKAAMEDQHASATPLNPALQVPPSPSVKSNA
jgi:hypothetical protein